MTEVKLKEKLLNYDYCIIVLCYLVAQFGYSMVNANVASFAQDLGATETLLGIVPGLMPIAALCARPFAGWVSDYFNRKYISTLMLVSLTLVFLGYAFSLGVSILLAVRIIHGVCFAFFTTVNMALVADVTPEKKLAQGLGYYGLCGNAVAAIAPVVGDSMQKKMGFRFVFLFAAVLYLIATLLYQLMHYKQSTVQKTKKANSGFLRNIISVKALPATSIGFCNAFSCGAITGLLLVYAESRNIKGASLYFTVFAVSSIVFRPLCSYLADRLKPQYMVYPCNLCIIITMLLLFRANSLWQIILAGIFFGLGYGGLQPLLQSMSLKSVNEDERGVASSTYYLGLDAGNGLGPVLCSVVASMIGGNYGIGFLSMIIPVVFGMIIMFGISRREKTM